jgi:fimbrial isopeptide formation D2 family protein/LPXTG-motif cell wall-anchored protein
MILFTTDQFSRKKKGIEIMKRLKKVFALLMAMIMVVSCVSVTAFATDEEDTTPTERSYVFPGQQKLTIHAEESDHAYILYQIFRGTSASSDGTISNVVWGDSVVDPDGTYDFSTQLITALKADNLPDGTTNPIKAAFADVTTTSNAGAVAAALGNIGTEATAKDAFATIAENVLTSDPSKTVKKDDNPTMTPVTSTVNDEEITTYNFVFDHIRTGYYLVDESFSSNASNTDKTYSRFLLQVASTDTRAEDKSQSAPLLDKKIVTNPTQDNGSATAEADMNRTSFTEAAMGDDITFELASTVPDMTYYSTYYFIVTDTLSKGLTFNDDMVVKVGTRTLYREGSAAWEALDDDQQAVTPWYRLEVTNNEDGTTTLKIVFHNFKQYTTGTAVDIHYTAELNQDAIVGWGKTSQNTNSAYLTYSNNPNYHYKGSKGDPDDPDNDPDVPNPGDPTNNNQGEEPVGVTPTQTVYVYTTSIDLTKTTSTGTPLSGAVFTISGTSINKVRIDTEKFVDLATATKTKAEGGYDFKADDSTVYYYLLKNGTYTSTAPSAATSTTEYVSTTVTATEEGQEDTVTYTKYVVVSDVSYKETSEVVNQELTVGADGELVLNGLKSGTYTITEVQAPAGYETLGDTKPIKITIEYADPSAANINDGCTWRVGFVTESNDDGEVTKRYDAGGLAVVSNELPGVVKMTVKNVASNSLPTTGGIGTTIFYAVGGTMLLAAMVLLITKRRMNHNVK